MADDLATIKCSHCEATGSIVETPEMFYCSECGWWGFSPNNLIYDYESLDDAFKADGQVGPKKQD